jgi:predicted nucleotidyltransferase
MYAMCFEKIEEPAIIMRMDASIFTTISSALKKNPAVAAALLFGSQASGQASPESDIDIALLYNKNAVPSAFDMLTLAQELSDLMHKEVDIVLLNEASPIIAMQAVKNGVPLFISDQKAYQNFEVQLITDYADVKTLRKPFENNILKRKLHG